MVKLVIIADDLTGALDTGVQFSKKNMSVAVTIDLEFDFEKDFQNIEVIVIDTESRHIPKEEAKERVKSAVLKFSRDKVKFFYKKTDSTLRGNIGSEIEGFMEGLGINEISFIPAFPSGKRIVEEGILYIDGIKVSETQFSNDILNPITESFIPNIIKSQIDIDIKQCNFFNFSLNKNEEKADNINKTNKKMYLFNGKTVEDIRLIGKVLKENNMLNFTIGNAGFAEILGEHIESNEKKEKVCITDNKILFVCGSINTVSLNQCKHAEKIGYISESLSFKDIISEKYQKNIKFFLDKEYYKAKWNKTDKFLIKTADSDNVIEKAKKYSKENNISMEKLTFNISANTGKLISEIVKEKSIKNMIVFGGDTLMGILKNIECQYIVPITEILPGVVFTKVIGKDISINLITKAGGFGDENIIEKIEKFIKDNISLKL